MAVLLKEIQKNNKFTIGHDIYALIKRYDEVNETSVTQHVEGWRDMHYKGSLGLMYKRNVIDGMNIAKSTSGDGDTLVDEVELLERSLDMYASTNELQQQLQESNARWQQQLQESSARWQQQINEMMQ
ncbi:hypothetical protein R6Q57_023314 [Mikania cordata]